MSAEPKKILITGPQWLGRGYFEHYYRNAILRCIADGCIFLVGAADGIDTFAQELLAERCPERVIVCNKGTKDGRKSPRMSLRNGFASYPERDLHMAKECQAIICTLPQFGGGTTGALYPLLRAQFGPTADSICASIREDSEKWDEKVLKEVIAPLYEKLYPSNTVSPDAVAVHQELQQELIAKETKNSDAQDAFKDALTRGAETRLRVAIANDDDAADDAESDDDNHVSRPRNVRGHAHRSQGSRISLG
jgi:hypothetical protein